MSHHDPGARRAGGAGGPLSSQADRQETLTSQDAVPRSSRLGSRPDAGQGLTQAGLDALASTLKQAVDRLLPFASENRTAGGGLPSLASVINPRDFGAASAPSLPTGFGSTVDPTADPGTQGSGFARLDLGEVLTSETPPAEAHLDASPSWPASPGAGFTPAFDRTAGTNAELPSSTPRGGVVDLMGLGDGSSQSPNPVMPFAAPAGGGFNVAISAPAPTPTGLAPTEAMGRAVVAAAATGRASESRVERVPIRAQGFANVVDETANLGPGTGPSALPFAVDPGDSIVAAGGFGQALADFGAAAPLTAGDPVARVPGPSFVPDAPSAGPGGSGDSGASLELSKTNDLLQQLLDEVRRGRQPFLPLNDRNADYTPL